MRNLINKGRTDLIFYGIILLLSLIVYSGYIFIASRSFFFQDDFGFLYQAVFGKFRFPAIAPGDFFRPISRELFFITFYHIFDLEPFGYFLINIAAHTLSAICLFFLLLKLELADKLSALVAFMFFSNLAAFEKISWISNFQHSSYQLFLILSALFVILSLYFYGPRKIFFIFLSSMGWIFALLSSQAGISFPMVLMLLLFIKIWKQNNMDKRIKIIPLLIKNTLIHWILLLGYGIFVFIPSWRQMSPSDPYHVETSIKTLFDNLAYYFSVFLPNGKNIFLIPLITVFILIVFHRLKNDFFEKHYLMNFVIILLIFGLLYAPFAFLKYQRYSSYVSLALVPIYVMVFYPLLGNRGKSMFYLDAKKIMIVSALCLLVLVSLPNKYQLRWYFKNSPKLYIDSVWHEAKSVLPEISEGIIKVVFVDEETFTPHQDVSLWQIPPFWWYTGFGKMFNILYGTKDIHFEISKGKKVTPDPNTIFIKVRKGPLSYSLSLLKP